MEWRIILPVLCLIGFLPVPGNAADNTTNSTFDFNIVFHINDTFIANYSNKDDNATISLKNKIIPEVTRVFSVLPTFKAFDIQQFRNGSIVVDGKLSFYTNDTKPIAANLTQLFNNASFANFTIIVSLTNITEIITTTNAPAITNQTTAAPTTVPAKLASIQVVFKILQDFKATYSNLSDPETIGLSNNITNAFTPFYKKRIANFFRMWIRKFSAGSIVAESVLEFDTTNNNSSPNMTDVLQVFNDALTNGNLSFKVDNSSINVTDITNSATNTSTTTQAATTSAGINLFNLTFKMAETFTNDLSNASTVAAVAMTNKVLTELDKVFKNVKGYKQTKIKRYSNGSVIVDAEIQCDKATSPTAADLAKALADAVRNGTVTLTIDPKSIVVTDVQTGVAASKSPVLAGVLNAFWLTLASLLLSGVMH